MPTVKKNFIFCSNSFPEKTASKAVHMQDIPKKTVHKSKYLFYAPGVRKCSMWGDITAIYNGVDMWICGWTQPSLLGKVCLPLSVKDRSSGLIMGRTLLSLGRTKEGQARIHQRFAHVSYGRRLHRPNGCKCRERGGF